MEKTTKTQWFDILAGIVEKSDYEDKAGALEFIERQKELLANKAAKAKEKAAEKKAEGDELRAAVEAVLTNEPQTIEAILAQIEGEDLTKAKITARLTSLVNNNIAVREEIKDGSRKIKAFRLADAE